jgi:hypothetical protein
VLSGVSEYRMVDVETNAAPPIATNDGFGLGAMLTNYTIDVTGVEGVVTGYLFAIDADEDRQDDRSLGPYRPYSLRIDTSPPLPVVSLQIVSDPAIDDTTEIRIQWTPAANTNMHEAAGWRSDETPLSPWDTYIVTAIELDGNDVPISTAIFTRLDGYPILGTNSATTVVLSNLNEGTTYIIGLAGRDRAGNEGPYVFATGTTAGAACALTAGFPVVYSPAVTLGYGGASNAVYDLIYADASSFADSLSNKWNWLARITNNNPSSSIWIDSGGLNPTGYARVTPSFLGRTSRFYRIAVKDRWAPTGGTRRAGTTVYAARAIPLFPGENWVSMHGIPDPVGNGIHSDVEYVFGTNSLPAGATIASATRISWMGPTEGHPVISSVATCVVWLSNHSGWQYAIGGTGSANDHLVPNGEGFLIELPLSSAPTTLVLVGRVATQANVHVIPPPATNSTLFYFASRQIPDTIAISNFVKQFGGFGAGPIPSFADEIRVLNNDPVAGVGMGSVIAPRLRAWYSSQPAHSNAPWRRAAAGYPSAMSDTILPNETVIIVRRTAGVVTWTNSPTYSTPTKTMSP